MNILLLGAGGLLGRHLAAEGDVHGHRVTALTHAAADITDAARLDELFAQPWDVVVNAAAICDFDACERDPRGTGRVNCDAPLDLARRCAGQDALFVQFSSDYVFRGETDRLLGEDEPPDPLSVYGRQKATLEREIPALCPRHLVLRISWLYGEGGRTFMSLLPGLLAEKDSLQVASGKKGRCLWAVDAAAWTRQLIEAGQTGLFNLVNDGDTSWEEFAAVCRERLVASGHGVRCREIVHVPFAELGPNWTKRPRYSCLATSKLAAALPPGPRPWQEALDRHLLGEKSVAAPRTV